MWECHGGVAGLGRAAELMPASWRCRGNFAVATIAIWSGVARARVGLRRAAGATLVREQPRGWSPTGWSPVRLPARPGREPRLPVAIAQSWHNFVTLLWQPARNPRAFLSYPPPGGGWGVGCPYGWVPRASSRRSVAVFDDQLEGLRRRVPRAANRRHGSGGGAAEAPLQGDTLPAERIPNRQSAAALARVTGGRHGRYERSDSTVH